MYCDYFENGQCRSCKNIQTPITAQVDAKNTALQALLAPFQVSHWLPPIQGDEFAFRNKAKMVALGMAHAPILGISSPTGESISLCHCPLYPEEMQQLLKRLEHFIQQAGLPPYQVEKAKGELKYILLTRSEHSGHYLLRFVLRSHHCVERIRNNLPKLLAEHPEIAVVSVNIQPIHMAILEGEEEIFLTETTRLEERFNDIPLYIRPKSFFQTNPKVAAQLYQSAQQWANTLMQEGTIGHKVWDLFCGVGGFGLHCANQNVQLTGIEIEAEAIACAQMSADALGLKQVTFKALDSTGFAQGKHANDCPDLIIVNPPRRGIGTALCHALSAFAPKAIIYSSCNPETLAQDLAQISGYQVVQAQLFDMFPHTDHYEVLVLLLKQDAEMR